SQLNGFDRNVIGKLTPKKPVACSTVSALSIHANVLGQARERMQCESFLQKNVRIPANGPSVHLTIRVFLELIQKGITVADIEVSHSACSFHLFAKPNRIPFRLLPTVPPSSPPPTGGCVVEECRRQLPLH